MLLVLAHVGCFLVLITAFVLFVEAKEGLVFAEEVFHEQIRSCALVLDRGKVEIKFLPSQPFALLSFFFTWWRHGWTFFD